MVVVAAETAGLAGRDSLMAAKATGTGGVCSRGGVEERGVRSRSICVDGALFK